MADALSWYAALALLGAASLYPAALLFRALPGSGVLYARALGLALLACLAWLPGAVGIGYGEAAAWAALAALLALSAYLAWSRPGLGRALWERRRLLLGGEILFIALYAALALVRSRAPDAVATEKPMDLRLLSAIDGAGSFPPPDPWFSGEPVSYYYLGHVGVDALAALASVPVGASFTLGVVTAGAVSGLAAFGLAYDLLASRAGSAAEAAAARISRLAPPAGAAVSAASLLWLAPLAGALEVAGANGWGRGLISALGVEGLPGPQGASALVPERFWWWWDATRLLPGVIAEFPAFSLLLGDLHAHLLALPLGVAALALSACDFLGKEPLSPRRWLREPLRLVLASALYAALAMTNSWDVLTWGSVWLFASAAALARSGWPWPLALLLGVRHLALPALGALALALPFAWALERPELGLALVADGGSEPVRFALFWLAPALQVLLAGLWLRPRASRSTLATGALLAAAPVAAWAGATLVSAGPDPLIERGSGWLTLGALTLGAGCSGALALILRPLGAEGRGGSARARLRRGRAAARDRAPLPLRRLRDAHEHRLQALVPRLAAARAGGRRRRGRGAREAAPGGAGARSPHRLLAHGPRALRGGAGPRARLARLRPGGGGLARPRGAGPLPGRALLPGPHGARRGGRGALGPLRAPAARGADAGGGEPELRGREPGLRRERRPDAARLAGAPAAVAPRPAASGA